MNSKSQSSFEFLSTYGWAIFAALAVIAVLATFGFTNLRNNIPSSCSLGADFMCSGASADTRGVVLIEFSPAKKLHIDKLICTYPDGSSETQTYTNMPALIPGKDEIIGCEDTSLSLSARKDKFQVQIVYHLNETDALPRTAQGEIVTEIQKTNQPLAPLTLIKD